MRPVRCANEHFFDADKYTKCPQCGADMKGVNSSSFSKYENKSSKNPLFKRKKKLENEAIKVPLNSEKGTFGFFTPNSERNEQHRSESEVAPHPPISTGVVMDSERRDSGVGQEMVHVQQDVDKESSGYQDQTVVEPFSERIDSDNTKVQNDAPVESSVAAELRRVTSNNEGKTVGYFNSSKQYSNQEGVETHSISDPVVGWLVCIKGPHFGESFSISSGKNSIGRSHSNRICISRDNSVSREKHAWIIYEPKKSQFLVQPGEASGLVYMDDENVLQPTVLVKNSVVELGNTKLMLIPLCGKDFSWETWLDK